MFCRLGSLKTGYAFISIICLLFSYVNIVFAAQHTQSNQERFVCWVCLVFQQLFKQNFKLATDSLLSFVNYSFDRFRDDFSCFDIEFVVCIAGEVSIESGEQSCPSRILRCGEAGSSRTRTDQAGDHCGCLLTR